MEEQNEYFKRKGGRPTKALKRNKPLTVKCTAIEQRIIQEKAKQANQTISEYLRTLGLTGKIIMLVKQLPKEVLMLTGALNHVGGLLNQIARKRNSNDELTAFERADLKVLERQVKEAVATIQTNLDDRQNNDREIL